MDSRESNLEFVYEMEGISLSILVTVIVAGFAILYLSSSVLRTQRSYPNGPIALPLLGNFLYWRRIQRNLEPELLRLKERWGGICMLWLGPAPVVIVNCPSAAKELLNEVRHTLRQLS